MARAAAEWCGVTAACQRYDADVLPRRSRCRPRRLSRDEIEVHRCVAASCTRRRGCMLSIGDLHQAAGSRIQHPQRVALRARRMETASFPARAAPRYRSSVASISCTVPFYGASTYARAGRGARQHLDWGRVHARSAGGCGNGSGPPPRSNAHRDWRQSRSPGFAWPWVLSSPRRQAAPPATHAAKSEAAHYRYFKPRPGYVRGVMLCCKKPRDLQAGEMAEWLKAHAWKACIGETLSRVRIPVSPPPILKSTPCRAKPNFAQLAKRSISSLRRMS